jgi:hypothetical protein
MLAQKTPTVCCVDQFKQSQEEKAETFEFGKRAKKSQWDNGLRKRGGFPSTNLGNKFEVNLGNKSWYKLGEQTRATTTCGLSLCGFSAATT